MEDDKEACNMQWFVGPRGPGREKLSCEQECRMVSYYHHHR